MRVFLDTNVLVSAFASRGFCADLFELVLLEQELIIGSHVLAELERTLRQKIKVPTKDCNEIVRFLRLHAAVSITSAEPVIASVDPDDAQILREALFGQADVFVTGDAALLRLDKLDQMRILSPRGLWDYLRSG